MHDIRAVRADPAGFDAALARRGMEAVSAAILKHDEARRAAQTALQERQARRNAIAKDIGMAKRQGADTSALEAEAVLLRDEMAALESAAAAAEREQVARRGRRLDETKPGSGLGLSIVVELAGLYGGTFTLGSAPIGGLRAELVLPAA